MHMTLRAPLACVLSLILPALMRRSGVPVRRAARGYLLLPAFER
jgi:hypothetical protein